MVEQARRTTVVLVVTFLMIAGACTTAVLVTKVVEVSHLVGAITVAVAET